MSKETVSQMRPIKFRAWDNDQRKFYYFNLDEIPLIASSSFGAPVQQFTGLSDKNGKEIYEGDVLKSTINERWFNWKVVFRNGAFGIINIALTEFDGDFFPVNSPYYFEGREVIGNIFEHSELLAK